MIPDLELAELRPAWQIAWLVARRRLEHPTTEDLFNPCPNIIDAIEIIVGELFDAIEGDS